MPGKQRKMSTNNNPNIIVTLVARSHRACDAWADPHNEPFYIPPKSPGRDKRPREEAESSASNARQPTPDADDPSMIEPSEPALQITFDRKPKNPAVGYLLGSDRKICDIYFGSTEDWISQTMFTMTVNQYNQVTMTSLNNAMISVSYDKQQEERKRFTWIFPAEQESIFVNATRAIWFTVEVPKHDTDKTTYERNCRSFLTLASSASRTLKLPKPSHQRHFYLRTVKIGAGGFGKVHKAISMPDGRTVAVKRFKAKNAWSSEAHVLRKISKTPHDNIVQFIDARLEKKPFLVMGLAPGGNLAEQHEITPFTNGEIVLILRQMLDALVFLHVSHTIIHRDVKMENILCDSRENFRLADFGIAKKGYFLGSNKGTKPWMAPEMFLNGQYTSAVDVYALGLVVARLLTGSYPKGYKTSEGPRWCEALIAHFNQYEERTRSKGSREPEQDMLTALVGNHMLRMKPEERESAPGCLERGDLLWLFSKNKKWVLDHSNIEPLEEQELKSEGERVLEGENNECLGEQDLTEDVDAEAVTEVRSLNTDEWLSLEREHPFNVNEGRLVENSPEYSATLPGSDGQSGPKPSRRKRNASPASPSAAGVRNQWKKPKWSS